MSAVFHLLSQVLGIMAFAMLLPATIGISNGDPTGEAFLLVSGLLGFAAGGVFFALRDRRRYLRRTDAVVLVVLVWAIVPLVGAAPLAATSAWTPLDAVFEAVSGVTTTGATLLGDVEAAGSATVLWRAELQWIGGLLTLITFAAMLAPIGIGGLSARGIATAGHEPAQAGRVTSIVRTVTAFYVTGTMVCLVSLVLIGVPAFDAVAISLSTVSTGGFLPRSAGLAAYGNHAIDSVVAIFMLVGATSIVWHRALIDRRQSNFNQHAESLWVFGVVGGVTVVYATTLFLDGEGSAFRDIWTALFAAISLVSTTGIDGTTPSITAASLAFVLFVALSGGAALSTAGGIKLYRIGAMVLHSGRELRRLVFPNSVRAAGTLGLHNSPEIVKALWANLSVALFFVIVAALLLSLQLPTVDASLTAAIAGFASIGPLYTAGWIEGWPAYQDFSAFSKVVMIVTMIAGRVEVFVLLAIVSISTWRS